MFQQILFDLSSLNVPISSDCHYKNMKIEFLQAQKTGGICAKIWDIFMQQKILLAKYSLHNFFKSAPLWVGGKALGTLMCKACLPNVI